MEVIVAVSLLKIHFDSPQAKFKAKLEESEVAKVIRKAVGNVKGC